MPSTGLETLFARVLLLGGRGTCAALTGCSSKPVAVPPNLTRFREAPAACCRRRRSRTPNAPPRIVRIWFSTLTIEPGSWFDGTIVGSTNVASVEVRTAAFSINSEHVAPGVYHFHMRVLELPPLSRRHWYELYIIARNTPGDEAVERLAARRVSAKSSGVARETLFMRRRGDFYARPPVR